MYLIYEYCRRAIEFMSILLKKLIKHYYDDDLSPPFWRKNFCPQPYKLHHKRLKNMTLMTVMEKSQWPKNCKLCSNPSKAFLCKSLHFPPIVSPRSEFMESHIDFLVAQVCTYHKFKGYPTSCQIYFYGTAKKMAIKTTTNIIYIHAFFSCANSLCMENNNFFIFLGNVQTSLVKVYITIGFCEKSLESQNIRERGNDKKYKSGGPHIRIMAV